MMFAISDAAEVTVCLNVVNEINTWPRIAKYLHINRQESEENAVK